MAGARAIQVAPPARCNGRGLPTNDPTIGQNNACAGGSDIALASRDKHRLVCSAGGVAAGSSSARSTRHLDRDRMKSANAWSAMTS